MKALIKKAVPFVFVLSSVAVAAGVITKDAVNAKVAALASAYNDDSTNIQVVFTDLNVDSVRALDFGVKGSVNKKGTENTLNLNVEGVQYHYGNGANPTVTGKLTAQLDLLKAFGQTFLNNAGTEFEELAKNAAATFGQSYGDALSVDAKLVDLTKDQAGNVVSAKVSVLAVVDFSKLPATIKVEDVEFKSLQVELAINRAGAAGAFRVVMNPANKSFNQDQTGMKEVIEKILSEDAEMYQHINGFMKWLNDVATELVNQKAQQ
ncbi:hypothetical protein [Bdellovibrio sp. NC01]|uniref:hypothetical protein n=1 Tax=Bdellovibrio sp. NC01 TaxID=2220073 RepID=UPI0011583748|nr:hypothetical protein [Bdellovibrio sp. NC01]QDK37232.1 hypothetical protein DOE51_06320 [Bdellovibrio sp. NC01]